MTEPVAAPATDSRKRALLILAGIVAALLIAYLLLSGGGDEDLNALPTPTFHSTSSPTPTASPSHRGGSPSTNESFEGRDPFQPLLVEASAGPGPAGSPTPGDTGAHGATVIRLIDLFTQDGTRMAVVEIDGEEFTAAEGETVNGDLKVLDLTKRCGTFLFGDERFTLCLGQEVRK